MGSGEQPTLAAGPGGMFAAWNLKRGGKIQLLTPAVASPSEAGSGADPVLAGMLDGKGPVVLVYEAENSVRVQRLVAK